MAKEKIEIVVANDDTRIEKKVDQVLPPIALLGKNTQQVNRLRRY